MQPAFQLGDVNPDLADRVLIETRDKFPEVTAYLQEAIHDLRSLRYIIDGEFDADEASDILAEDLPASSVDGQKDAFISDVVRLCSLFSSIKTSGKMKIQLEIVNTNMCRLFHEDHYRQRLLCTYMGPGTEWLDESNVNRAGLGKGSNAGIVKDFEQVNKAGAFDVLLLKGSKYGGSVRGVVHRSPPIEKEKKIRVLLKIDE